ncbi:MAG: PAS domain-containing protein [Sneathiella sp.]|nr:PAS domain-containing protein [Sneathiella sp.]
MTDTTLKLELNSFLSDDAPDESGLVKKAPWKIAGLLFATLAILSYFMCDYAIETRKQELLAELQKRLEVSAAGKAKVIETWLSGTAERANRIASNELFQLFAAEINLAASGSLPTSLTEQLPYMQNAFTSFANQDALIGAYLIGKDGRAYLAAAGSPSLTDNQREKAREQYSHDELTFLPMRTTSSGLVFDFVVPIRAAQSNLSSATADIVGVLLLTVPASEQLTGFLKPAPLSSGHDVTRLFQVSGGEYFELYPFKPPYISAKADPNLTPGAIGFETIKLSNGETLYSSGAPVSSTDLAIFQQVTGEHALVGLDTYALFISGLAISFLFIIFSILTGIWLTLKGQNARALANQYKDFAAQINVQRRLLGSINNTIDELIGLTDPEGRYIYANPSLARLADCPLRSIPGKTDRDLFGEKTARELAEYDRKAIATEQTVNAFVEIKSLDGVRTLRVAKSRFLGEDGVFLGIVTVSSDITEYVEHQRHKEEMDHKAIKILAQMLEANDPYLSDHSSRMGKLAGHIAAELGLSTETMRIINTSAHLSQIGKISIPREIRAKETRLTAEEQDVMQKHVLVAEKILVEAEVEKSILDAVTQINEHLDGSGYPNGLKEAEIDIPARILGMADILIARISPRSYREAITVDEVLRVFRNNPEKYDQSIVDAMFKFFETEIGTAFKANIEKRSG